MGIINNHLVYVNGEQPKQFVKKFVHLLIQRINNNNNNNINYVTNKCKRRDVQLVCKWFKDKIDILSSNCTNTV